jgi:hypothetical protein
MSDISTFLMDNGFKGVYNEVFIVGHSDQNATLEANEINEYKDPDDMISIVKETVGGLVSEGKWSDHLHRPEVTYHRTYQGGYLTMHFGLINDEDDFIIHKYYTIIPRNEYEAKNLTYAFANILKIEPGFE